MHAALPSTWLLYKGRLCMQLIWYF